MSQHWFKPDSSIRILACQEPAWDHCNFAESTFCCLLCFLIACTLNLSIY